MLCLEEIFKFLFVIGDGGRDLQKNILIYFER